MLLHIFSLIFFYAQARAWRFAVRAACGPCGGQGENRPVPARHGQTGRGLETLNLKGR